MVKNSRPTIAFLTNFFTNDLISSTVWSGIYSTTKELDINIFCFPGISPYSPREFESGANSLLSFVHKKTIDGIIIWGGTMWGYSKPEHVMRFYKQFSDYALVNIGPVIKGLHNITIDNYKGMFDGCIHLIEHHGYRRIAFIRGPESQGEAELRFAAYKDALKKNNISIDPDLIIDGFFVRESGSEGIKILLDERHAKFEAIVAASDLMALGAIAELKSRGITVPGDIKIVGFDDIAESQYQKSPLTTVKQPFKELGKVAVETLLSLLSGKECKEITLIPSHLIIRQSCGCLDPLLITSTGEEKKVFSGTGKRNGLLDKDKIITEVLTDMKSSKETEKTEKIIIENLVKGIIKELDFDEKDVFLPLVFDEILKLNTKNDMMMFNTLLTSIRDIIHSFMSEDPKRIIAMENLWHKARKITEEYSERLNKFENLNTENKNILLQRINRRLVATFDIDEFMNIIAREFPRLGINTCFLSLYENQSKSLEKSGLKLAYINKNRINLVHKKIIYSSYKIIPDEFIQKNKRFTYIVESLFFEVEQLGYIVYGEDFTDSYIYEILRTQLSAAIKGALLIQEKEKLLARLENHAHNLQMTMEKLKQSNTELEQFSYIASHDLKEPLRKIRFFSNRLLNQYDKTIDDKGIDYLKRMGNAADRMQILINNLLDYSHLTTKARPFSRVNLSLIVQEVLTDIELLIEQKQAVINIDELPFIDADPNQIQQLFQNLLTNALKFSKPGKHPQIKISHSFLNEQNITYCEIVIEDNGIGIKEQYFDKIFGIFQRLHTRKEYEGTGIGLAICKKVVDRHHGRISVASKIGKGTRFIIMLPVNKPDVDI
ncbi:MAG: substrate-binding domain-containing protein [Spirochaetales bacterium]|nr:substrate-binding domain-containing protein [Spirochaetales bacterium]